MSPTERLVIETSLKAMFKGSFFSICSIRDAMKVARIPEGGHAFTQLQALHCVPFADMGPEMRNAVVALTRECLSSLPFDPFDPRRQAEVIDVQAIAMAENKSFRPRPRLLRLIMGGN